MNSKISFCSCSSPSCVLLKTKNFDAALTQNLLKAQQKLIPVINTVIGNNEGNSKELKRSYYLTVQQYEDVVWAQKILREFNQTHLNSTKDIWFDLEKRAIKTNKFGQVYVDTPVLLQLIELHKMLGHIIQAVKRKPVNNVTSSVQTDLPGQSSEEGYNMQMPPHIDDSELLELQDENKPLRFSKFENKKLTDFVVMYSTDEFPEQPSSEETREDGRTEVTDVAGARKIIIQCLSDLNKVKNFLERETVDTGTTKSRSEVRTSLNGERGSLKREPSGLPQSERNDTAEVCECDLGTEKMSDSSRIVICIRDKDECQGAVQVIIKQCSWCRDLDKQEKLRAKGKILEEDTQTDDDLKPTTEVIVTGKPSTIEESSIIGGQRMSTRSDSMERYQRRSIKIEQIDATEFNSTTNTSRDIKTDEFQTTSTEVSKSQMGKITEVHIIHGDQDTCTCTTSSDSEKLNTNINVIFNPEDPVNSVVEPPDVLQKKSSLKPGNVGEESLTEDRPPEEILYPTIEPSRKSLKRSSTKLLDDATPCSRIKLCETANLCFSTANGEELIVSLTIRPNNKSGNAPPCVDPAKLSLKDIFSESEGGEAEVIPCPYLKENMFGEQPEKSQDDEQLVLEVKSADKIKESEGIIPLPRTRICSSLEFDVTVVDTRLRNTGIKHFNPNVVVKLREIGVDNILRACRPAKCCRKAVLNEKLRKCLPYPPSLHSLPLDEGDVDEIKASLESSVQNENDKEQRNKIQQYAALVKNYPKIKFPFTIQNDKYIYHCSITRLKQSQAKIFKDYFLRKKLSYYINLVHDVYEWYAAVEYKIYYFEVKTKNAADILLKVPPPLQFGDTQPRRETGTVRPNEVPKENKKDKMKMSSKIPIYKFKNNFKNYEKNNSDSLMYDVSLSSLPIENEDNILNQAILKERKTLHPSIERRCSQAAKTQLFHVLSSKLFRQCDSSEINLLENLPHNLSQSIKSSNQSIKIYRQESRLLAYGPRRKKQEFYVSKSKSEISIKATRTLVHFDKKMSRKCVCVNSKSSLGKTNPKVAQKDIKYDENLKVLLDYFVDLFFNFMVKEIAQEIKERGDVLTDVSKTFKSAKGFKLSEKDCANREKIKSNSVCLHSKSKSQVSISINTDSSPNLEDKCFQTDLSEQKTVSLQTSATDICDVPVQFPENHFVRTKLVQDKEDESLLSKIDSRFHLLYGYNSWSKLGLDEDSNYFQDRQSPTMDDCICKSMLELQEYNDYIQSKWQFSPIDFFVYQNYGKSSGSFVQKIVQRSRNILNLAPCKCEELLKVKYKNEKAIENSSKADCKICDKCNCYLDLCKGKPNGLTKYCSCPHKNKAPKQKSTKGLKRPKPCGHWLSSSFVKAASKKSLDYLKKSIHSAFRTKDKSQKVSLCACSRPKKDEETTVCYNPNVQDISVGANLPRPKTCLCKKCPSFAEDGTCKCSHCLKELDKSIATEVSNNDVGVSANYSKDNIKKGSSKEEPKVKEEPQVKEEPRVKEERKVKEEPKVKKEPKSSESEIVDYIVPRKEGITFNEVKAEESGVKIKNEPVEAKEEQLSIDEEEEYTADYEESDTYYFTMSQPRMFDKINRIDLNRLENGVWTLTKMNFCPDENHKGPKIIDITEKPTKIAIIDNINQIEN